MAEHCPDAGQCADAFHVACATETLDEVRHQAWNQARDDIERRRAGRATGYARALKRARYALWKNPENLTDRPRAGRTRQMKSEVRARSSNKRCSGPSRHTEARAHSTKETRRQRRDTHPHFPTQQVGRHAPGAEA